MADLLDHVSCSAGADVGDVGVGRGLDREKAWLAPLVGAIQIYPFKEDNMITELSRE
jgi:hypothetical protein